MGMYSGDELHAESFCDEVNMCHCEGQPVLLIFSRDFQVTGWGHFLGRQ